LFFEGHAFATLKSAVVDKVLGFVDQEAEDVFDFSVLLRVVCVLFLALGSVGCVLRLRVDFRTGLVARLVGLALVGGVHDAVGLLDHGVALSG